MNIIIPLGGKGERFSKNGYSQPKPLIQVFEKTIIEYVLTNLNISTDDKIFIIYSEKLDDFDFSNFILTRYSYINLIKIQDTKGAAETLFLGINYILNNFTYHNKCLILDCDTFYTQDIVNIFKKSNDNIVFYTKNYDTNPIYSYIELNDENIITNIKEKIKISDNANTGAYAFTDIKTLHLYCKQVLDKNITFNNEHYTSCVISEMIASNILFKGHKLQEEYVFSLGTPVSVQKYIDNTYGFLFDLDGTIVLTDEIYIDVWQEILSKYNILLTKEIFNNFIQGNNDKYVLNTLLKNIDLPIQQLSNLKDNLFIKNINKIKIIDGIYDIIKQIKSASHKICIVTNCNKKVANEIIKYINIHKSIDFIISGDECVNGKPHSEPYLKAMKKYNIVNHKCIIFEDSKSGILSGKGINPKLLVGIETIYDRNDILKYGVDFSVKNYLDININELLNKHKTNIKDLKSLIKSNSYIQNIESIYIDDDKLKGGFIADVISFKIKTKENQIYCQILKYENKNETNLSLMAKQLNLYDREYYFYKNIAMFVNLKIPQFYNIIYDNDNVVGIVLENLLEKNYKINLNLNSINIDVTLKIVDRMAKMHSKFWNKNLKIQFPELKNSNDAIFKPFLKNFIDEKYQIFKNKWFEMFNSFQIDICNNIHHNFEKIQEKFSNGPNLTLIHGDIKSPNIFYDIENDYEPYFIDWQHCAIGKGTQDLIFFIIESFDINNIKLIFNLLKQYYYKKLIEYGINIYSFEEYESDIYYSLCYIPFFTSIWFGTTPQDELIDKNFPFFFINKLFYLIELINNK